MTDQRDSINEAYLRGFMASRQGWNGEQPPRSREEWLSNMDWCHRRDEAVVFLPVKSVRLQRLEDALREIVSRSNRDMREEHPRLILAEFQRIAREALKGGDA